MFSNTLSIFPLCSSGNKCLLKVALYSAQLENYAKAIAIYEEVNGHKRFQH